MKDCHKAGQVVYDYDALAPINLSRGIDMCTVQSSFYAAQMIGTSRPGQAKPIQAMPMRG